MSRACSMRRPAAAPIRRSCGATPRRIAASKP
jgi:hypothetical protein